MLKYTWLANKSALNMISKLETELYKGNRLRDFLKDGTQVEI